MFPGVEKTDRFLFYGLPEGIVSNAQLMHRQKINTVLKTTPLAQGFPLLSCCFYFIYIYAKKKLIIVIQHSVRETEAVNRVGRKIEAALVTMSRTHFCGFQIG